MSIPSDQISAQDFITRALQAGYEVYCSGPPSGSWPGRELNLFKPLDKVGDFSQAKQEVALLFQNIPLEPHRGMTLRKGLGTRLKHPAAIHAWRNGVEERFLTELIENLVERINQQERMKDLTYRFNRKVKEEVSEDPEVRAIQGELEVTEREWEELRVNLDLVEARDEQLRERLEQAKVRASAARQEHLDEYLYVAGGREL